MHSIFQHGDVFVSIERGQVEWRHPDGTLNKILETGNAAITAGMAFDKDNNLYVTNFNAQTVVKFAPDGTMLNTFGSGYNSDPESILFDAAGNAYVGQADGSGDILKFDAAGNFIANFDVARQSRGSDWIELAEDQHTMFYTSEGNKVKRFDVQSNMQLDDFATLPHPRAFALRLLPSGSMLVANFVEIVRLDTDGNVMQTYDAPGENSWFALNLDPDGKSFWSAGALTGNVYKFDIDTGDILLSFTSGGTGSERASGLAVKGEITVATLPPTPPITTQATQPTTTQAIEPTRLPIY